jgi:hypothetical protein
MHELEINIFITLAPEQNICVPRVDQQPPPPSRHHRVPGQLTRVQEVCRVAAPTGVEVIKPLSLRLRCCAGIS